MRGPEPVLAQPPSLLTASLALLLIAAPGPPGGASLTQRRPGQLQSSSSLCFLEQAMRPQGPLPVPHGQAREQEQEAQADGIFWLWLAWKTQRASGARGSERSGPGSRWVAVLLGRRFSRVSCSGALPKEGLSVLEAC